MQALAAATSSDEVLEVQPRVGGILARIKIDDPYIIPFYSANRVNRVVILV